MIFSLPMDWCISQSSSEKLILIVICGAEHIDLKLSKKKKTKDSWVLKPLTIYPNYTPFLCLNMHIIPLSLYIFNPYHTPFFMSIYPYHTTFTLSIYHIIPFSIYLYIYVIPLSLNIYIILLPLYQYIYIIPFLYISISISYPFLCISISISYLFLCIYLIPLFL